MDLINKNVVAFMDLMNKNVASQISTVLKNFKNPDLGNKAIRINGRWCLH